MEPVKMNNEEQRSMLKIGTALFGEPEEVGGPINPANRRVIMKMFGEPEEVMRPVDPINNANMRVAKKRREQKLLENGPKIFGDQ